MLLFELEYQLAPVFCIFLFLTLWAGSSVRLWRAQHLSNCHASCIHKTSSCSLGFLYLWNRTTPWTRTKHWCPCCRWRYNIGSRPWRWCIKMCRKTGLIGPSGLCSHSCHSLHSGRWMVGGWRFVCLLIGEFARCTLIVNFCYYVLTRDLGIWLGLQSPPLEHSPFQILLLQSGWLTAQIHEW